MTDLERAVHDILATFIDPCSCGTGTPLTVEEMGLVTALVVSEDGNVIITLRVTQPGCVFGVWLERELARKVGEIGGVASVTVTLTDDWSWSEQDISADGRARLAAARARRRERFSTESQGHSGSPTRPSVHARASTGRIRPLDLSTSKAPA
jgi:metal-sulfur cluster biosynthetic enzyme